MIDKILKHREEQLNKEIDSSTKLKTDIRHLNDKGGQSFTNDCEDELEREVDDEKDNENLSDEDQLSFVTFVESGDEDEDDLSDEISDDLDGEDTGQEVG